MNSSTPLGQMHRKGLVFLLMVLLAFGAASAQLKVKSFRNLQNDLTANTEGTRRVSKQDGRPAALIKIVTNETGFTFDGGTLSIVDVVPKSGEIWVYVPARAQKISISHPKFGMLRDYFFDIPLEAAKTYELVLDPGVGKYATIQTSTKRSVVYLDGDSLGVSPIYNAYILYGPHKLSAKNDRIEGSLDIDVKNDGSDKALSFTIPMEDQSAHFSRVTITTEPDATILMNGEVKGVGSWTTELREGDYVVETQKINCDNQRTSFTVKPRANNQVQAKAPIPHKGYLVLYTRPHDANVSIDGKDYTGIDNIELPVGNHVLTLSRNDFYNSEKEYTIRKNVTLMDTIDMERIQYLKKNQFYLGAGAVVGSTMGAEAVLGGTFANIDLQLSYMLGLQKSNPVYFYGSEGANTAYRGSADYKVNRIGVKLGYQIPLMTRFGIVPQVGASIHSVSGNVIDGNVELKNQSATCGSIGAKLIYSPMQHFCLAIIPEYDIVVSKGNKYDELMGAAGMAKGGFFCNIGIILNF